VNAAHKTCRYPAGDTVLTVVDGFGLGDDAVGELLGKPEVGELVAALVLPPQPPTRSTVTRTRKPGASRRVGTTNV
jgi:hypothetical protein